MWRERERGVGEKDGIGEERRRRGSGMKGGRREEKFHPLKAEPPTPAHYLQLVIRKYLH